MIDYYTGDDIIAWLRELQGHLEGIDWDQTARSLDRIVDDLNSVDRELAGRIGLPVIERLEDEISDLESDLEELKEELEEQSRPDPIKGKPA
jgi:chromosome segregation ATPase